MLLEGILIKGTASVDEGRKRTVTGYGGQAKYERLARVKAKYDPDNIFHLNHNIKRVKKLFIKSGRLAFTCFYNSDSSQESNLFCLPRQKSTAKPSCLDSWVLLVQNEERGK